MSVTGESLEWLLGRPEAHTDHFRVFDFKLEGMIKDQKIASEKELNVQCKNHKQIQAPEQKILTLY